MNKLSINLLPKGVLLERIQSSKFNFVNKISIGVLILIISLTAGVLFLRVNQNKENDQVNNQVKEVENQVATYSDKESAVFALKNRLDAISSKLGTDLKVKAMFNLIINSTPPDVNLYDVSVDKNGSVVASFTSSSLTGIDRLLAYLTDKKTNSNLVSKVDLNGISLGRDAIYHFSLKVTNQI